MERKESRETVFQSLMDTLKKDRIKTFAYPISELGLVQLTRKRTRHNIVNLLTEICPNCEGSGYIKSRYTVCYEVLRELRSACRKGEGRIFNIYLSTDVANLLYEEEKTSLEQIESAYGTKINLIANPNFAIDKFQIEGIL